MVVGSGVWWWCGGGGGGVDMDVTDCVSSRDSMELLKPPPIQVYSLLLWGAEIGVHCTPTVPSLYPHCTPLYPHCTHSISFNERRRRKSRRKEEEEEGEESS